MDIFYTIDSTSSEVQKSNDFCRLNFGVVKVCVCVCVPSGKLAYPILWQINQILHFFSIFRQNHRATKFRIPLGRNELSTALGLVKMVEVFICELFEVMQLETDCKCSVYV